MEELMEMREEDNKNARRGLKRFGPDPKCKGKIRPGRPKYIYHFTKDGKTIEGDIVEVLTKISGKYDSFKTTIYMLSMRNKPWKYKGYDVSIAYIETHMQIYKVVTEDGQELFRNIPQYICSRFGVKLSTLKNYISINKPIVRRRKKYYIIETDEWEKVWRVYKD